MPLSIKQKQVLGVTTIVVLVVLGLSVLHIGTLVRVLLEQAAARAQFAAESVSHQMRDAVTSRETAYQDLRSSATVRAALEAAMYSPEVLYAAIVDRTRTVVAANDTAQVGRTLPSGEDLATLVEASGYEQVRVVYSEGRTLEFRQPLALGDEPFGEIAIGVSLVLIRNELRESLQTPQQPLYIPPLHNLVYAHHHLQAAVVFKGLAYCQVRKADLFAPLFEPHTFPLQSPTVVWGKV